MQALLSRSTRTITLARNEYLNEAGRTDTNLYFIESGSLRAFALHDGEEQNIRFGYSGNVIALLDSFLRDRPSAFTTQAIKPSVGTLSSCTPPNTSTPSGNERFR